MNTHMWVDRERTAIPNVAMAIPVIMVGMAFLFFTMLEINSCNNMMVAALITVTCSTSKNQSILTPNSPKKLLTAEFNGEASTYAWTYHNTESNIWKYNTQNPEYNTIINRNFE